MAVFKNCRLVTGAICKGLKSGLSLFEVKEWFSLCAGAALLQGGEKPAPCFFSDELQSNWLSRCGVLPRMK
jgi:hypothetical protein